MQLHLLNLAVAPTETDLIRLERFKSTRVDFSRSTPRSEDSIIRNSCDVISNDSKCEAGSVSVTDDIARKLTAWYPETVRVTIRAGCVTSNP